MNECLQYLSALCYEMELLVVWDFAVCSFSHWKRVSQETWNTCPDGGNYDLRPGGSLGVRSGLCAMFMSSAPCLMYQDGEAGGRRFVELRLQSI